MNSHQLTTVATAVCQTAILAGALAWVIGFEPAGIEKTEAAPIAELRLPAVKGDIEIARPARLAAVSIIAVAHEDIAAAAKETTPTITTASLGPPREAPRPEPRPMQLASISNVPDPLIEASKPPVNLIEVYDECLVAEVCIDRYLWALYQRTPKEDTIKVYERRKVAVKRRGKTVLVTRTFSKLVDEDFTWKDPKAADKARMSLADYVIGGMDRRFKQKLFHVLRAAEIAGLSPGITSAFRDDYRQSIASGIKAASNRSFHGGSLRGGYGHGIAADIVSVAGGTRNERWASSEALWKWVDAHQKEFGIARPYSNFDPPHVAPTDGREFAAHRGSTTRTAEVKKKRRTVAARAARAKTAKSSAKSSRA